MNSHLIIGAATTWFAIAAVSWLGWQLLRQNGRILLRLDDLEKRLESPEAEEQDEAAGLPVGSPAPEFSLPELGGVEKSLASLLGQPALLIFFNPECGYCRELVPRLARSSSRRKVILISTGAAEANRRLLDEHGLKLHVLLQREAEVAGAYRARGTPSGYLLDASGRIVSELVMGADALLKLAEDNPGEKRTEINPGQAATPREINPGGGEQAGTADTRAARFRNRSLAGSKINRDGLKAGTPAPEFRLPRLKGGELALTELRGRSVFLVFSSPHCAPCNELVPKLERFQRQHPGLQVVMISRGEPAENREKVEQHGLTFPVLLQRQWEVSREYGIFATPVAYLIDGAGVIQADVAVGLEPILGLMARAGRWAYPRAAAARPPILKRLLGRPVGVAGAGIRRLTACLLRTQTRFETLELKHFKFVPRADDIFIVTYPRSGTTWLQMILYQLTTEGSMSFSHIAEHSPWFERSADSDDGYENRPGPRVFKSHLTYRSIPKGPGRYIYVARDGRDVAISYYHLYRSHNGYKGTFDEFFELFMAGKVMFGSWFEHVGGWWNHRNDLNVLFLTYEELASDLEDCLRRIMAFCRLEVPPDRLPVIAERCTFAFMKQHEDKFDPAVETLWAQGGRLNCFLRAGRAGEGVSRLSQDQQARFRDAVQGQLEPTASMWPAFAMSRRPSPALANAAG